MITLFHVPCFIQMIFQFKIQEYLPTLEMLFI